MVLLTICAAACGINQEHYDTARQARAFGAADRGMLAACVPDSATNIHMVIDHDSGRVWLWCDLDAHAQSELRSNVRAVGWSEARASATPPPFSFNFPDWNPILGERMVSTPPPDFYFIAGAWHGLVNRDGRCWMTLCVVPPLKRKT